MYKTYWNCWLLIKLAKKLPSVKNKTINEYLFLFFKVTTTATRLWHLRHNPAWRIHARITCQGRCLARGWGPNKTHHTLVRKTAWSPATKSARSEKPGSRTAPSLPVPPAASPASRLRMEGEPGSEQTGCWPGLLGPPWGCCCPQDRAGWVQGSHSTLKEPRIFYPPNCGF